MNKGIYEGKDLPIKDNGRGFQKDRKDFIEWIRFRKGKKGI